MMPSMQNQPQNGGNPGLAALFGSNQAAAPGMGAPGMGAPLPQIMAPQRPNIPMPVRTPMPQPAAGPAMSRAQQYVNLEEMVRRQKADARGPVFGRNSR